MVASQNGHHEVVERLLNAGAFIDARSKVCDGACTCSALSLQYETQTAWFASIIAIAAFPIHEILLIERVILCTPIALNLMFLQLGVTALFAASRMDHLLVMDVLLKRGANRELAMTVCIIIDSMVPLE